jgi:uncharacterized protein (DUF1501 family)
MIMCLTRRHFLTATAAAGLLPSLSFAALPGEQRLVVLVLRGAMDGLSAVPPYFDRAYKSARGAMALAESDILELDGRFGLHQELTALHALYKQKQLTVVHAVATPYRDRSHFDAQNLLEGGGLKAYAQKDGWLNRSIGLLAPRAKPWGLAVGATTPFVMSGHAPVTTYAPSALPDADTQFLALAQKIMAHDAKLAGALGMGMEGADMAAAAGGDMVVGGRRQNSKALAEVAGKMLRAADGPRLAVLDIGGWDTHVGQANRLPQALRALNEAVTGLRTSLNDVWGQTVVLAVSEFGRTVAPNGSGGTDHGTAGAAFVMGGAVEGGRVLADWPGLDRLYQNRDLAPTTDIRALLKAVLAQQWGLSEADLASRIFPGSADVAPLPDLLRT